MLLLSGQYPAWRIPPGLSAHTQVSAGDPEAVLWPSHPLPHFEPVSCTSTCLSTEVNF